MPATATATTSKIVEIDGAALDAAVDGQIESVVVTDRLAMPDTFTLIFRDPNRDILGKAGLEIGKKIEIKTNSATSTTPESLIKAEVTSIETEYDSLGTRAVVRGYDLSHRLAAGRKTATYQNVTYSDIASQVASAAGLQADCDATSSTFDHVFQVNQSDLDFLYGLARQIGYDCRVDGDTLVFKKPVESSSGPSEASNPEQLEPLQLHWGENLQEFRARMTAVAQVAEVEVRGWDPAAKQEIIGKAQPKATNAELALSPSDLAAKVGGQTLVVVNHGVTAQDAADQLATSRAEQIGSAAFEATAVAVGDPQLKAGVAVNISGVDPALCGKWTISGSRHEFGAGPYRTALEFTGRQDRSILGLVNQGTSTADRLPGVVTAIVDDNNDPDAMGRVRLRYPWMGDQAVSYWARLMGPGAGKDSGVVWMPQVGDEVLVSFEHGDPSHPVVLGGLWNGTDTIPFDAGSDLDNGKVTYCGFTSRTGHKISFFESSGESKVHLMTAGGEISVVLDGQGKKLEIDSQGDIKIHASGNLELVADGNTTIKGAQVAIN
jgi:phage protein D/phage baseplate assembly protein gpV